jgi:cold shock CspA family protein
MNGSTFLLLRSALVRKGTVTSAAKRFLSDSVHKNGTVRHYDRSTVTGSIIPDDGSAELSVTRSSLVAPVTADQSIKHPFLWPGERVSFEVITDAEGQASAANVMLANGEPVPPLRRGYYATVLKRAKGRLGSEVFTILSNENLPEEEQNAKITEVMSSAKMQIQKVEQLIELMGMKVEDFPTVSLLKSKKRGGRKVVQPIDDME